MTQLFVTISTDLAGSGMAVLNTIHKRKVKKKTFALRDLVIVAHPIMIIVQGCRHVQGQEEESDMAREETGPSIIP